MMKFRYKKPKPLDRSLIEWWETRVPWRVTDIHPITIGEYTYTAIYYYSQYNGPDVIELTRRRGYARICRVTLEEAVALNIRIRKPK